MGSAVESLAQYLGLADRASDSDDLGQSVAQLREARNSLQALERGLEREEDRTRRSVTQAELGLFVEEANRVRSRLEQKHELSRRRGDSVRWKSAVELATTVATLAASLSGGPVAGATACAAGSLIKRKIRDREGWG